MHVEEMKSKNGDLCKTNFNRTLGGGRGNGIWAFNIQLYRGNHGFHG